MLQHPRFVALLVFVLPTGALAQPSSSTASFCEAAGSYMQEIAAQRAAGVDLDAAIAEVAVAFDAFATDADDLANRYSLAAEQALDNWDFYMALGYFKVAIIAAGIAFRAREGGGVAADTDEVDKAVGPLMAEGLRALGK